MSCIGEKILDWINGDINAILCAAQRPANMFNKDKDIKVQTKWF